ncbi:MAG: DNA-binding protein [Defluviitaleaceae bacterium]|nr:DNA-binding protein [Defluviitaleaceae bacterium]
MENLLQNTLLYDFYSPLLTQRQRDIYHMYFFDDMSLAEISSKLNITRQAVNFSVKQSQKSLVEFESLLNLVEQHGTVKQHLQGLEAAIGTGDIASSRKILQDLTAIF